MSRPTGPNSKSTPMAVQEPTLPYWKQSGMTPSEALAHDKSSVRKPISPRVTPSQKG
jgi:hypothetical protein